MGSRIVFDQILAGFHGYRLGLRANCQADLHLQRQGRSYVDILGRGLKPGCRSGQVVVVIRDIGEIEFALTVARSLSSVVRNWVLDRDSGGRDARTRRIQNRSMNRSAAGLSKAGECETKR